MRKMEEYYDDDFENEYEYLTPKEVMELLCIGRSSFYKLANSGEIPAFRIGKLWRVRRNDLKAVLINGNVT